jgi:hypothetical protein
MSLLHEGRHTHPDEMYIVGAHMDGHGWGEAANDDGSGTALVMELARVFSSPDVQTERTIRFALWNNEETGSRRARLRRRSARTCRARRIRQDRKISRAEVARDDPARHDDVRSRHAAARRHDAQGAAARGRRQRRISVASKMAVQSQALAWALQQANEKYAPITRRDWQPHDQHRFDRSRI